MKSPTEETNIPDKVIRASAQCLHRQGFAKGGKMSNRFYDAGAAGYDRIFGFASREFVPTLLRLARLAPGQRVLDVATGTGIAAEAASEVVGPTGFVVAADISVPMLDQARKRLSGLPNISFTVENGQALNLPDANFDTVLCSMGLMMFPDHAKGLSEFHRVLKTTAEFPLTQLPSVPFMDEFALR